LGDYLTPRSGIKKGTSEAQVEKGLLAGRNSKTSG